MTELSLNFLADKSRRIIMAKGQNKIHKVMSEFKRGSLKSSSGAKVRNRKQAIAIALSEAREAGARIPKRKYRASSDGAVKA